MVPHELPVDEENEPPNKRTRVGLVWKKEDVQCPPLPEYVHPMPDLVQEPFQYFSCFFTEDVISHIVYQTNLYARQENLCSNFVLDDKELMVFIGLVIFMGVTSLPSIVDYWKRITRIPQVADFMSKNRFKQIRATLHFNDNHQCRGSQDRFYKIRPLFTKVTKEFLKVKATPVNSIDEVMVAYKGTRAGNLRQYIANKPDKWGYKLFCRSSVDGFVHDILMYQGATTFETHPTPLGEDEKEMNISAKVVLALVRTLKDPKNSAVYADNYFTSLSLAQHLRSHYGCRYVGTARENRIGHPPLRPVKEMEKKSVRRGELDYLSSDGILAARWKDNKVVTILSTDVGIEPKGTVLRYDKTVKQKKEVQCPALIRMYNGRMGGIDKSDMLVHLY